jgi:hypothetical protein
MLSGPFEHNLSVRNFVTSQKRLQRREKLFARWPLCPDTFSGVDFRVVGKTYGTVPLLAMYTVCITSM